ncbi:MAG: hypothetical protein E6F93_09005 [Actinobacteria bacterium]|nr:MAG: hypothetical protein E6F93_09005 [Actinomycetota bacterium]
MGAESAAPVPRPCPQPNPQALVPDVAFALPTSRRLPGWPSLSNPRPPPETCPPTGSGDMVPDLVPGHVSGPGRVAPIRWPLRGRIPTRDAVSVGSPTLEPMGRTPRIQFSGALYHVTTRGNAKQRVCLDDWDFVALVTRIGETVMRYGWVCHSYCLLGNHFHLSVATPEANLAKGMRILNGSYAQRFNRRYDRVGHVFQGRYGAELLRRHEHMLEVSRYIALNPVRAGICLRPELWPWSSYCATIGLEEPPPGWP